MRYELSQNNFYWKGFYLIEVKTIPKDYSLLGERQKEYSKQPEIVILFTSLKKSEDFNNQKFILYLAYAKRILKFMITNTFMLIFKDLHILFLLRILNPLKIQSENASARLLKLN